MANTKGKVESGSGGKLGHSNMSHARPTEEIKDIANKQRRAESHRLTKEGIKEASSDGHAES